MVDREHAFATTHNREIESIVRLPAGYGKVAVVDELRSNTPIGQHRVTYVGDGSSDVHVMLHVNRLGRATIAVSEDQHITPIPILEDVLRWDSARIRSFFEAHGFALRPWDKIRTDSITLCATTSQEPLVQ
jgi:hypothetical protein